MLWVPLTLVQHLSDIEQTFDVTLWEHLGAVFALWRSNIAQTFDESCERHVVL